MGVPLKVLPCSFSLKIYRSLKKRQDNLSPSEKSAMQELEIVLKKNGTFKLENKIEKARLKYEKLKKIMEDN